MFLDAERYRDRVGATSVIEAPHGEIADRWIVFASVESEASRRLECPCHAPFARLAAAYIAREYPSALELPYALKWCVSVESPWTRI